MEHRSRSVSRRERQGLIDLGGGSRVGLLAPTLVTCGALILNIGAGRFRAASRRFSVEWFLWVHLPVLAIFPLRIGFGLSPWVIPILVAAAIGGQFIGGRLSRNT